MTTSRHSSGIRPIELALLREQHTLRRKTRDARNIATAGLELEGKLKLVEDALNTLLVNPQHSKFGSSEDELFTEHCLRRRAARARQRHFLEAAADEFRQEQTKITADFQASLRCVRDSVQKESVLSTKLRAKFRWLAAQKNELEAQSLPEKRRLPENPL